MKSVLVSLSSGLDSTLNLYWANKAFDKVEAMFFNYGQKALKRERENSRTLCEDLSVKFTEVDLSFLANWSGSSLTSEVKEIPQGSLVDIENQQVSLETAKSVWVPNRNGVFIGVLASYAEAQAIDYVAVGFNREEAANFPDNSSDFVEASNKALSFSTSTGVKIVSVTAPLDKSEIFSLAKSYGVDFSLVWPCYFGYEKPCGKCESCLRYERAKDANQATD